jgi:hypothetical protein
LFLPRHQTTRIQYWRSRHRIAARPFPNGN